MAVTGVGPLRKPTNAVLLIVAADAWPSTSASNRPVAILSDLVPVLVSNIA